MNTQRNLVRTDPDQPVYVLTMLEQPTLSSEMRGSTLLDLLRILWSRKISIAVGTLLGGAVFLAGGLFLLSPAFESRATLIISPPQFTTELNPPVLDAEAYRRLAESDAVLGKVQAQDGDKAASSFSTIIYQSSIRNKPALPLVDLVVSSESAAEAAALANAWAEIAVAEIGDVSKQSKNGVVAFIEREYPLAKQRLADAELELKQRTGDYEERIRRLRDQFNSEITAFKSQWNLRAMAQEVDSLQGQLSGGANEWSRQEKGLLVQQQEVRLRTTEVKAKLEHLKAEIQSHPHFLVLSKAITDNALWSKIGQDPSGDVSKQLESLSLKTEEQNPVYTQLAKQLADVQTEYEALVPQEAFLKTEIASLRSRLDELNRLYLEKSSELEVLQRKAAAELGQLERDRDMELGQLSREVASLRKTYETLSEKYESARLAKVEEVSDLKIGAQAVANVVPVRPNNVLNAILGLAFGCLVSAAIALLAGLFQAGASPKPAIREANIAD